MSTALPGLSVWAVVARAPLTAVLALVAALVLTACVGTGPGGSGTSGPPPSSETAAPSDGPLEGAFGNVPTACLGLGEDDCRRVLGHVAAVSTATDPRVRYLQVGPFGCAAGGGCPTSLVARPEGDVTIETASGTIGFHVKAVGDRVEVIAQERFGIDLAPTSSLPLPIVPQSFALGHCGLWSGVDLGGSWWDPVGVIDSDHADAINAAEGTIALTGPDRATFTSKGGLVVQLVRRDGQKFLPLCR